MMSRCKIGARAARTEFFSCRRAALLTLACCGWLTANPTSAQDPATLALDVARRAWETHHPCGRLRPTNVTIVDMRQEGRVNYAVVRVEPRRKYFYRPRVAEVCAAFLFQPNRTFLIDLDYHEPARYRSPNIDRSPEIIAEYNIELERLAYSPEALLLGDAHADAFGAEAHALGRREFDGGPNSSGLFGQHNCVCGLREKLGGALFAKVPGAKRSDTTPDAAELELCAPYEADEVHCADACTSASNGLRYPDH